MRFVCVFVLALLGQAAAAETLREMLDRVWARSPQAQTTLGRTGEVKARQGAAESWLPAPPAFSISQRSDRWNRNAGQQEWEAEIELPLWLPGEQAARRNVAESEQTELEASQLALRLSLAGELREAAWTLKLADNEVDLHRQRVTTAQALEKDVERRVKAGDLARIDLNLAQSETLSAQAAVQEAEIRLLEKAQVFSTLTGVARLPVPLEEPPGVRATADTHPLLISRREAVALAQAKLKLATETRRDSPELSFSGRRERGGFDETFANTVGVKLRIPFATDARNRPLVAAANTELIQAHAEYRFLREKLELEVKRAQQELNTSRTVLELARARQRLAGENLRLAQRAFDLGEFDLAELLRRRLSAHEADLALARQSIEVARGQAKLNQAQGVLP